jgi:hypothetical protein
MLRPLLLAAGLAFLGMLAPTRDAAAVLIHVDTSVLPAGTSARLDFSLFDGDFDLGNNTVTVSGFATDGTLQGTDCSFGCTGGPPYLIDESVGFGEFLQDLVLGTYVDFDLAFTANFNSGLGGVPDLLVLNLLDPGTNLTLVDTDLDALSAPIPYQDAMLLLALTGNGDFTTPTVVTPIAPPGSVPEPPALALLALALGLLAFRRGRSLISGGMAM